MSSQKVKKIGESRERKGENDVRVTLDAA